MCPSVSEGVRETSPGSLLPPRRVTAREEWKRVEESGGEWRRVGSGGGWCWEGGEWWCWEWWCWEGVGVVGVGYWEVGAGKSLGVVGVVVP